MRGHLAYLRYAVRHKWFVGLACREIGGIPFWRWVMHDWTKFLPSEWGPYVRYFYESDGSLIRRRDATGHYQSPGVGSEFDVAWLHHQKRNKHHWQYWVLARDDGTVLPLAMPDVWVREMLADWRGAGRAQNVKGSWDATAAWYQRNRGKMSLHPATAAQVEFLMARRAGRSDAQP